MAVHDDAFAERLALCLDGEVVVVLAHGLMTVDRPGELGERMPDRDQRLLRRALDRAPVRRRQARGMDAVGSDRIDQRHVLSPYRIAAVANAAGAGHQAGALKS
jgi:hypothetical protein